MENCNTIYAELKKRIINLDYKPGELLNEKELINEFNVSRTPIREALLKLSEKGLVNFIPRVGIYVSQIELKNIKNIYEIKKNLEALSAELASQRATKEEGQELINIAHRIESYDAKEDFQKIIRDDKLFHRKTSEFSRNENLISILDDINGETARFLQHINYVIDEPDWFNSSVMAIANAIADGDKERASIEAEKHTVVFLKKLSKIFFT
ncbi:MAG: GntR family transcriptional regulator [Clostridiaceae bacterium]